ncbi:protein FAM178B [Patagioenas fasciata]|uniref:protein FAM178B n=1 Tax=Patagioenas fasciata TaxID=372321 RepID=UPI0032E93035
MAPHPEELRWYQIPLSSARIPRSGLFSFSFQDSLQRYQQLRAHKNLRVGRPVAGPPPGLLEPWPPSPAPAHSPPRGSYRPRGAGGVRAPWCPKKSPGTKKRVSRARRLPSLTQPQPHRQDVTSSTPSPVTSDSSGDIPVLPEMAAGSPGGDSDRGQHAMGSRSSWGHSLGTVRDRLSLTDSEDDEELIPLRDMLLAGDMSPSPPRHQQVMSPWPDLLANSLDSPVQEQRERDQAAALVQQRADDTSSPESLDEDSKLPEEHRDILARFAVKPRFIPTVHPGEPIFCARPVLLPLLDTRGLESRNNLEALFFCESPAWQVAFVRNGCLSLLYNCLPTCPPPVLRWLFQLMTLCPDTINAAQALWDIWLSTRGECWCPTVQEISEAFARLGADLTPLLPAELRPTDGRSLEPSSSPRPASPNATDMLALVTQLGAICKFLALCVVTQPCHYPDSARLSLVTLLSFLGLDRALRCQPLPEVQVLLHYLLQGIHDWHQQLPALCRDLCQLSRHHHNLVALMQLLPDFTSRDRELRRHLSLHAMAQLLGEPPGVVPPPEAHAELQVLCRFLVLARPDALRSLMLTGGLEEPADPDWEACYLSYSLLLLASNVVGTEQPPAKQRGHLELLCSQLDQLFGRGLRESTQLLFRTQLKGLAILLYVKWQEMLAQGGGP